MSAEKNPQGVGVVGQALLNVLALALNATTNVLYDIILFPLAAMAHSAIKHVPILGPTLVNVVDTWLARLSDDWPDKLP